MLRLEISEVHDSRIATAAEGMLIEAFIAEIQHSIGRLTLGRMHIDGDLIAGLDLVSILKAGNGNAVDLEGHRAEGSFRAVVVINDQFLDGDIQRTVYGSNEGIVDILIDIIVAQVQLHSGDQLAHG